MNNSQKGSVLVIILILALVIVAIGACIWYRSGAKNLATGVIDTPEFSTTYSTDIFALVPFTITLPLKYDIEYPAIKLIATSSVPILGQKKCWYGEVGAELVCKVASENGVAFVVVDESISNLMQGLDEVDPQVTIAGKLARQWEMGMEGDGAKYYYLPLSDSKTLIIQMSYRNIGLDTQFPAQSQFDNIIAHLKLK